MLKKNEESSIEGTITSSNCTPEKVWAKRFISTASKKLYLHYVPGSAIIHNNILNSDISISDGLFTSEGVQLGVDKQDGVIPCGIKYSGYVEYTIETEERTESINQLVSYDGFDYRERISLRPGMDIYVRIDIANNKEKALSNVVLKGYISKGMELVSGSVTLSSDNLGFVNHLSDEYISEGYNLGTVEVGSHIFISYKCRTADELKPGDVIINSAYLIYNNGKNIEREEANTILKTIGTSLAGWGPKRETFTVETPAPYVTFNSIVNNPALGDERLFVKICEANGKRDFKDEIRISAEKIYEVSIFYHNCARPSLAETPMGIAHDVKVKSSFPRTIAPQKTGWVKGTISSSNAMPSEVWSCVYITSDEELVLSYVPDSLRLHSFSETHGNILDKDEFFSNNGTLLSTHMDQPGIITSKNREDCGYITYCISAEPLQYTEQNNKYVDDIEFPIFNSIVDHPEFGDERQFVKIRKHGDKQWKREVVLQDGAQYEVEIFFRNDALPKYNGKEYDRCGVAFRSCMAVYFPNEVTKKGIISARIFAENSMGVPTDEVTVSVQGNTYIKLAYIAGSAVITNKWKANGSILSTNMFDYQKGTPIGLNELNGIIPGGDEFSGSIRFVLQASDIGHDS